MRGLPHARLRGVLRHRRGPADRGGDRRRRPGRRRRRRGLRAAVPLLPRRAEGDPARDPGAQEARPRDDRGRRRLRADPRGLHLLRAVRRPRPDVRQDDGRVRLERVRRRPDPGPLAGAGPRLAVRQGPGEPRLGEVLQGRPPPQDGQDRGGRRASPPSRASTCRATTRPSSPTSATTRTSRSPRRTSRSSASTTASSTPRCRRGRPPTSASSARARSSSSTTSG